MHAESSIRAGRVIPAGIWAWSPRVAQGLTIEGRPESEAAEESQIKARGISEAAEHECPQTKTKTWRLWRGDRSRALGLMAPPSLPRGGRCVARDVRDLREFGGGCVGVV